MKADRRRDEEELTAGMSRWRAGVKVFLAFQKPPDGVLQNSSFLKITEICQKIREFLIYILFH